MKKIYLYILASSKDEDNITCTVPFRIDENEIFFGPCKKRIRRELRKTYLARDKKDVKIIDDIYMIGVNGKGSNTKFRKIVYVGKLKRVMTFKNAYNSLTDNKYQKMRKNQDSPLHVKPIIEGGKFIGYEKNESKEHQKEWPSDISSKSKNNVLEGKLKARNDPWLEFDIDCCMLLENIFYADGRKSGLKFDDSEKIMNILKKFQPERAAVDCLAIFGRNCKGYIDGRKGGHLNITGESVDDFIHEVKRLVHENNH